MAKKDKDTGTKDSSKVWSVFSLVSALGAAAVAKKVLNTGWQGATGKDPPENPADPDVAAARGRGLGSRSAARSSRSPACSPSGGPAHYYQKSTGRLPPGLGKDEA